jgi:hypothetical protein
LAQTSRCWDAGARIEGTPNGSLECLLITTAVAVSTGAPAAQVTRPDRRAPVRSGALDIQIKHPYYVAAPQTTRSATFNESAL